MNLVKVEKFYFRYHHTPRRPRTFPDVLAGLRGVITMNEAQRSASRTLKKALPQQMI